MKRQKLARGLNFFLYINHYAYLRVFVVSLSFILSVFLFVFVYSLSMSECPSVCLTLHVTVLVCLSFCVFLSVSVVCPIILFVILLFLCLCNCLQSKNLWQSVYACLFGSEYLQSVCHFFFIRVHIILSKFGLNSQKEPPLCELEPHFYKSWIRPCSLTVCLCVCMCLQLTTFSCY